MGNLVTVYQHRFWFSFTISVTTLRSSTTLVILDAKSASDVAAERLPAGSYIHGVIVRPAGTTDPAPSLLLNAELSHANVLAPFARWARKVQHIVGATSPTTSILRTRNLSPRTRIRPFGPRPVDDKPSAIPLAAHVPAEAAAAPAPMVDVARGAPAAGPDVEDAPVEEVLVRAFEGWVVDGVVGVVVVDGCGDGVCCCSCRGVGGVVSGFVAQKLAVGHTWRVLLCGRNRELAGGLVHFVADGDGKDVVPAEEMLWTIWPCLDVGD
ncbi:MAG: hypothetical protein ALECFALPRED_007081 [Alectoria fallacina]|uniref:Uncharacterized protein n=1 Tax=Alectoria fallacina TaxID=1903189 RepID=A0A8H3I192_9LECA|nr:MAG: hypothetical protein ALECFALPRED_007081 [Alectoria fallacina]